MPTTSSPATITIDSSNALGASTGEQSNSLASVTRLHNDILGHAKISLQKSIEMGKLLLNLKTECGHGKWRSFVVKNLPFADRTASNYMRLATCGDLIVEGADTQDYVLHHALASLRKPRAAKGQMVAPAPASTDVGPVEKTMEPVHEPADHTGNEVLADFEAAEPEANRPLVEPVVCRKLRCLFNLSRWYQADGPGWSPNDTTEHSKKGS